MQRIFGDQFSMAIFIDVCAQFVANSLEEKLDILRTTDTLDKLKKVSSMFDKISKRMFFSFLNNIIYVVYTVSPVLPRISIYVVQEF